MCFLKIKRHNAKRLTTAETVPSGPTLMNTKLPLRKVLLLHVLVYITAIVFSGLSSDTDLTDLVWLHSKGFFHFPLFSFNRCACLFSEWAEIWFIFVCSAHVWTIPIDLLYIGNVLCMCMIDHFRKITN